MHISEGILSPQVLVTGAVLSAAGVAAGLRKMDHEKMPRVAVLSSAFFIASLIHVRFGFSSVHLILTGLVGIILGWTAFPALLVALLLQGLLFQFGGLTTLGINTLNMALPAVICYYLFNRILRLAKKKSVVFAIGSAAGALSVFLSILLMSFSLFTSGKEFKEVAVATALIHVPILVLEGIITGSITVFLRKVCPEILETNSG